MGKDDMGKLIETIHGKYCKYEIFRVQELLGMSFSVYKDGKYHT